MNVQGNYQEHSDGVAKRNEELSTQLLVQLSEAGILAKYRANAVPDPVEPGLTHKRERIFTYTFGKATAIASIDLCSCYEGTVTVRTFIPGNPDLSEVVEIHDTRRAGIVEAVVATVRTAHQLVLSL